MSKTTPVDMILDLDSPPPMAGPDPVRESYTNHPQNGGEDERLTPSVMSKIRRHTPVTMAMNGGAGFEHFRGPPISSRQYFEDEFAPVGPPPTVPTYMPTVNCIDIVNHVSECPLCSRFYANDKSMYLFIIIILVVFIVILAKRIIDKM